MSMVYIQYFLYTFFSMLAILFLSQTDESGVDLVEMGFSFSPNKTYTNLESITFPIKNESSKSVHKHQRNRVTYAQIKHTNELITSFLGSRLIKTHQNKNMLYIITIVIELNVSRE